MWFDESDIWFVKAIMQIMPHLFKKSMCSFCLIIPVFIIIVWNVCLSIAHILTSVSAEKETITEEFDILPAKALMMFKFFIITQ